VIFVCLMPFYASAGIVDLSVHLSVYRFCGHDILKLIALILLQIGKLGPWGTGMKQSTIGPGGQRLRSHDAEVRFGDHTKMLHAVFVSIFVLGAVYNIFLFVGQLIYIIVTLYSR